MEAARDAHDGRGAIAFALSSPAGSFAGSHAAGDLPRARVQRQHREVAFRRHQHPQVPVLGDDRHPGAGQILGRRGAARLRGPGGAPPPRWAWMPRQRNAGEQRENQKTTLCAFMLCCDLCSAHMCLDLVDSAFPHPAVNRPLDAEHAQAFDGRVAPRFAARDDPIAGLDRRARHRILRRRQLAARAPLEAPGFDLPVLVVTSIRTNEWGFRQTNSLTTPSTSTRLVLSYAAVNEWCADTRAGGSEQGASRTEHQQRAFHERSPHPSLALHEAAHVLQA